MRAYLAAVLLGLLLLVRLTGAPAEAQVVRRSVPTVTSPRFSQVPIRSVVERLFRLEGIRPVYFWPAPENVTLVSMPSRTRSFDLILQEALDQARLEFRYHNGHYLILTPDWATAFDEWLKEEEEELSGPQIVAQTGHPSALLNVAFSPDGRWMASGCEEGVVQVWDITTGISRFTLPGRLGERPFTPSSRALITAVDEEVLVWDLETGRKVFRLGRHGEKVHVGGGVWRGETFNTRRGAVRYGLRHGGVESATFTPDGGKIVTSGWDRSIKIWSAGGRFLYPIETPGRVYRLAVNRYGNLLAGTLFHADHDPDRKEPVERIVRLWDISGSPRPLKPLTLDRPAVSAWFTPDGRLLCADDRGVVSLWDINRQEQVATLPATVGEGGRCALTFTPGGKRFVSSAPNGCLRVWDTETLQPLGAPVPVHGEDVKWPVSTLAFSEEGDLAVGVGSFLSHKNKLAIWDVAQLRSVRTFSGEALHVNQVLVSPDGSIIAGGTAGIRIWDPQLAQPPRYLPAATPMTLSPNGRWLAARQGFDSMKVWEVATGKVVSTLQARGTPWGSSLLAFSPDGTRLAMCPGNSEVALYDAESGVEERVLRGNQFTPRWLQFSGDGKLLATLGDREDQMLRVWDSDSGKPVEVLEAETLEAALRAPTSTPAPEKGTPSATKKVEVLGDAALTFSPLHGLAALHLRNQVYVVRADNLRTPVKVLREGAALPVFHPDGRTVAVERGGQAPRIEIWRQSDTRPSVYLNGSAPLKRFNPAGTHLVAWNRAQNSPYLFDLKRPSKRWRLVGHTGRVEEVGFTPDGRWIVTASQDGTVRLWDINTGKEAAALLTLSDTDYMVRTPDNYYWASRGAVYAGVAVRIGEQTFPFEQADLQFNRPDLVLHRLGKPDALIRSARQDVEWRWRRCGYQPIEASQGFSRPKISVATPPASSVSRDLQLKVLCESSPYPLETLHVMVNGVPVHGRHGLRVRPGPADAVGPGSRPGERVGTAEGTLQEWETTCAIQLSDGENVIQVFARNTAGIESYRVLRRITYTGSPHQPDLYVVAVGVSKYQEPSLQLGWAAKDATDLAQFLDSLAAEPSGRAFVPEAAPPIVNKPASTLPAVRKQTKTRAKPALPRGKAPRRPLPAGARTPAPTPGPSLPVPSAPLKLQGKRGLYRRVHVQLLVDGQANEERIRGARQALLGSHPDDHVVVFLAGHGVLVRDRYYFVTADATLKTIEEKGIPYEDLEDLVNGIPARRKMLLLDSCHSGEKDELGSPADLAAEDQEQPGPAQRRPERLVAGGAFRGLRAAKLVRADQAPPVRRDAAQRLRDTFADLRQLSGAFVISAAGWQEFAWEGDDLRNGTFTFALLKGLSTGSADLDGDGDVRIRELRRYVSREVLALTRGRQAPTAREDSLGDDYVVYRR